MRNKYLPLMICLAGLMVCETAWAQEMAHLSRQHSDMASSGLSYVITVSGTVTDENGLSMPGVNVIEKGTTQGTTTDASGNYSLTVEDENTVLVFSFIGYETQEVPHWAAASGCCRETKPKVNG